MRFAARDRGQANSRALLRAKDAWRLLNRLQPSESVVLGGAAAVVGLLCGIGVWAFKRLIDLAHLATFGGIGLGLGGLGSWTVALMPVIGGLVVGLMLYYLVRPERQHGVAGIMESVALSGGRLNYKALPAKALAAAISIGSGASVGPEDPSVQIGANAGSMLGQWLHLSDERVRTLAVAGAAGGIAAAFNAPIAGVFFGLEIVLGEFTGNAFSVVLAAVISAVFTQAVSGPQPAFAVPAYAFHSPLELPLDLGLGILAGPVAALYIRALYVARDAFHSIDVQPWLKPVLGGLGVGIVGLFLPQVFGVGYDTIGQIFNGPQFPLLLLLALLAAKLIATAISIGAGFPGGVFAPSLYLGAALGAAFGLLAQRAFPSLAIVPAAFAMVGMAAVLAGTVHAPLTAIILLFEMTNDYRIILPLMLAVIVSLVISQRLHRESVYTFALARLGIRLDKGRDVEVLEAITVGEVMEPDFPTLRESDRLVAAAEVFANSRHHGLPVVNAEGALVGILTVQDLERERSKDGQPECTVGDVCTRDLLVAYPGESIGAALRRMGTRDVGRLPVVSRDDPRRLIGVLRRADMVKAYDVALTRRAARLHRANEVLLGAYSEMGVVEIKVATGAACVGKRVSQTAWPRDCVIATLRRGRQILIPHGDTVLRPGDVLVVVAEGSARAGVEVLCAAQED